MTETAGVLAKLASPHQAARVLARHARNPHADPQSASCGSITNIEVLIPPDTSRRRTTRRNWDGGRYDEMRELLATERGGELYRKRQPMIEPVFAR